MPTQRRTGWEIAAAGIGAAVALPPLMGWAVPAAAVTKIAVAGACFGGAWWLMQDRDPEQTHDDRDAARYLIGRPRSGKTTLAKLWFAEDIAPAHSWTHLGRRYSASNPRGAAWVTTHGAQDVAAMVREDRLVLYSPPATRGLNIVAGRDPYSAANRVSTVMQRMWPDLGDNQRPLLYTATLTVAQERPGATLWDVLRFVDDAHERRAYAMESEIAARSWADPQAQAVRGLVGRLGRMLASPRLARGLADVDAIDLEEVVRQNLVLVCDLTQDDTADALVLAESVVNMLQQVMVRRPASAQQYPVYLDEFQSYADDAVAAWIEEGGKRHAPLTLIHQSRKQLSAKLQAATLSCGTIYAMLLAIHDARELAPELGLAAEDAVRLTRQPTRHYHARILSRGRVLYRKARVSYVDAQRRANRRVHRAPRRDDDVTGGARTL